MSWLARAAEAGFSPAQVRLADAERTGHGAPQDWEAAVNWYRKAALQGDPAAALALGRMLLDSRNNVTGALTEPQLAAIMDRVFGRGEWRQTGGYRTDAREAQLRAAGAGTVPVGVRSRHSLGSPGAPGAYDVVVAHVDPSLAAKRLRVSGYAFERLVPETAHGDQGPHLHVEPRFASIAPANVGGLRVPSRKQATRAPPSPAARDEAQFWLAAARHAGLRADPH
jgi:hypothetical protein